MKKLLTLLLLAGTFMMLSAQDDTVRHLIFTEWRGDAWTNSYMELTNVGDSTLHLDRFTLQSMPPNRADFSLGPANAQVRLSGTLEPGETFIGIPVMEDVTGDGSPQTRIQVLPYADLLAFRDESGANLPWDSISPFDQLFRLWGNYPSAIWYHLPNGDSVVIDAVNNGIRDNGTIGGETLPVAGVAEATVNNILVRKAGITQGNTNWETSRGVSEEDSEWIVIPQDAAGAGKPFTTLGSHGDFSLSISSSTINIDLDNSKITVPWGLWKGDSIINEFVLGPGIAWDYLENAVWEDSIHVINQTGDVLEFFACGNQVDLKALEIEVLAASNDMALVFPTRVQNEELNWTMPYYVTQEPAVMDTVGSVPYATRVDSLFAHLEKAENANWEIVFVDGVDRPDLINGDILKVTAEDGSTVKEYYIDVEDYMASIDPLLGAITWPDMPGFISDQWKGDTIPGFNPSSGVYTVKLPYGTTAVPALKALPQDRNAKVETDRAVSLGGGMTERTTVFTVTAEDDTSVMVYNVTFEVEKDFSSLQKYEPEPFFAEFVARHKAQGCFIEIMNSGTQTMDMSRYMVVMSKTTKNPAEAILEFTGSEDVDYANRYRRYVPGWKYTKDTASWRANPAVLEFDPNVDPMVEPGDVFVIQRAHPVTNKLAENWEEADVTITPSRDQQDAAGRYEDTYMAVNPWNEALNSNTTAAEVFNDNHFLFRIDNDSVYEGTKGLTDPNDFTLVDVFGDPVNAHWTINGREFAGNAGKGLHVYAKPHLDEGVQTPGANWGTIDEEGDWIVEKKGQDVSTDWEIIQTVGFHIMDPVTKYQSTISSLVYKVSEGFTMEDVRGVVDGTSVDVFYGNIIPADDGQTMMVKNSTDGAEKTGTDELANGDTLLVTSKDMANVTKYVLEVTAGGLDNNTLIVAADGSGYLVAVDGETGTIGGFPYLTTLSVVMDNLEIPSLASSNVMDVDGNLVPMQQLNGDTVYVQTQVSDLIYIEVVAENGTDMVLYQLQPEALSSDAFVVSTVYSVVQESMMIENIPDMTAVVTLMANVTPVTGASLKVIDKAGFDRPLGITSYDDVLVVTSEDGSNVVHYYLTFQGEQNPDVPNQAPVVSIVAESTAAPDVAISVSADVEDDGLPEGSVLTYLWEVTTGDAGTVNIASPDQLTSDVTFSAQGNFTLSLTVSDSDLETTATHNVAVNSVGIGMFDISQTSIYPNPATEMVKINFGGGSAIASEIRIVDMLGKVAYLGTHFDNQVQIGLESLEAGMYFVIVEVEGQTLNRKLNVLK